MPARKILTLSPDDASVLALLSQMSGLSEDRYRELTGRLTCATAREIANVLTGRTNGHRYARSVTTAAKALREWAESNRTALAG